jgi:uncharacterized protein (TIGR03437 family)
MPVPHVGAQILDPLWEGPERLSTYEGHVVDRAIAVDSRGRSLACWVEDRLFEEKYRIYCRRLAAAEWSEASMIEEVETEFAGAIAKLDLQIDRTDTVQLVYSGSSEPIYHRRVSADKALNYDDWSGWRDVPVTMLDLRLVVDVKGGMVLLFTQRPGEEDSPAGVFAVRSTDNGDTWSDPVRIDPGIPEGWLAKDIEADFDGSVLHAVWNYLPPDSFNVIEVKTAYSTDGGKTWSNPIALESLAGADPGANQEFIRLAIPEIQADGPNVHVVYAGGGALGVGRRHVYSTDGGKTWTEPVSLFGALEGAAGTDATLMDSLGRVHMLAQLRYPQGIYHAMWDAENGWTEPEIVYLIAQTDTDVIGPRVHAQWFEATIDQADRIALLVETCAAGCQDDSTWPQNPITFGLHTIAPLDQLPSFTTVSSATFAGGEPVAAESIAAGFSEGLSQDVVVANESPLPTSLNGVRVEVLDFLGDKREAGLQFVSPGQINYVIPEPSYPGPARARVLRNGEIIASGRLMVSDTSPSIYTVNGQGTGVAAATWLFVAKDGTRTSGLIFDPRTGKALPIELDPSQGEMYLSLFGTGIRHFRESVRAQIGDNFVPVLSVGPQGQFDGLDQINLGPLPEILSVGAQWDVQVVVDGQEANRTIFVTRDRP